MAQFTDDADLSREAPVLDDAAAIDALAAGTKAILDGEPVQGVLAEIVRGAALATSADLAVARRLRDGRLEAC
ncbi:MAG TPA: hypothetical protein VES61_01435, partial [Gaiellaceae bacterium]|nr:hypothetical protein [Gaiellaceae bacterium]